MSKLILLRVILQRNAFIKSMHRLNVPSHRFLTTDGQLTIDGITKNLHKPDNSLYVPHKFCKLSTYHHIRPSFSIYSNHLLFKSFSRDVVIKTTN